MTRGATVEAGRPVRRSWTALVVVLAVLGIFLTACSSGGSSSTSSGATGGSAPNKKAMATVLL
jgi:hypothetical protein